MNNNSDNSGFYAALLFIIWPFLSLVSAFRNYRQSWGKNILWAFTAFYGLSFAIGGGNQGSDIVRYIENFQNLHSVALTPAGAVDYFLQSGEVDILRTLIDIVLSRFTDSQPVLTLVYGTIFGFFFSRNMWFLFERLKGRLQPITIILIICFFLVLPFWKINGFRMWTAAHIFVYGVLQFLFEGRKKGILISVSSIFVHFSFIVPVGVIITYMLLGNRLVLYFCFFLITIFFSEIDIAAFNNMVENYAPEIIQERTESYRDAEGVEEFREPSSAGGGRWYANWYGPALTWSLRGFLIILFFKERNYIRENMEWLNLFSFTLLFTGMANILSSIPSGGRFYTITELTALALIILYIQNRDQARFMKRFTWVATPALLLYIIVAFRIGLYSMSATAIFGNPVIALFLTGEHLSLNDALKMFL